MKDSILNFSHDSMVIVSSVLETGAVQPKYSFLPVTSLVYSTTTQNESALPLGTMRVLGVHTSHTDLSLSTS